MICPARCAEFDGIIKWPKTRRVKVPVRGRSSAVSCQVVSGWALGTLGRKVGTVDNKNKKVGTSLCHVFVSFFHRFFVWHFFFLFVLFSFSFRCFCFFYVHHSPFSSTRRRFNTQWPPAGQDLVTGVFTPPPLLGVVYHYHYGRKYKDRLDVHMDTKMVLIFPPRQRNFVPARSFLRVTVSIKCVLVSM